MQFKSIIQDRWVRLSIKKYELILGSITCVLAGALISMVYLHGKDARSFRMWQSWYSPAVGIACGYGYTNLPSMPGDNLEQFLNAKVDTFNCSNVLSPDKYPPVAGRSDCKYLIGLVGILWHFTGPSWHSVKLVIGFLYGLMALATFLLARTIIGTSLSVAVTLVYVSDPGTMELMMRLRDLGKAPFILLVCAALLWVVGNYSRKWLGMVALTGLVIGVGYGFRPDILILIPLGVIFILILVPREVIWYKRLVANIVLISVFVIGVMPIILSSATTSKSALSHAVILGLSPLSDYNLGVQPGNYSWGINQADNAVVEAVNAYSALTSPNLKHITFMSPAYERAGLAYLLGVLRTFPGDMALRVEASAVSLTNDTVMDVFRLKNTRAPEGLFLIGLVFFTISGCFCIGHKNPRKGIAFGLMFVYLIAIMALQFEHRHHFYMEVFVLMSFAAIVEFLVVTRLRPSPRSLMIITGGSVLFLSGAAVIVNALQQTQSIWVEPRLEKFISSPRQTLSPVFQKDVVTVVTFPQLRSDESGSTDVTIDPETPLPAYPLVMTIDRSRCGSTYRYFRVDYGALKFLDYTFWIQSYPRNQFGIWSEQYMLPNIGALGDEIQVTVPLYRDGAALQAIELSPAMANCVVRWDRLYSKDAVFDLMNWIVDHSVHVVPYSIELDKPRPAN